MQEPFPNRHGKLWSLAVIAFDISGISVYLHSAAANPLASALMSQIHRDLATGDILTLLTLMDGRKEGRWRSRGADREGEGARPERRREGEGARGSGLVSQVALARR